MNRNLFPLFALQIHNIYHSQTDFEQWNTDIINCKINFYYRSLNCCLICSAHCRMWPVDHMQIASSSILSRHFFFFSFHFLTIMVFDNTSRGNHEIIMYLIKWIDTKLIIMTYWFKESYHVLLLYLNIHLW